MTLEQLIEDYKRRIAAAENMLDATPTNELIKRERLKTKAAIESMPTPEPLDPYTCELCVGDEVEILSDSSEYAHGLEIGLEGFITCVDSQRECPYQVWDKFLYRSELKLIHRNGATIKEVSNE